MRIRIITVGRPSRDVQRVYLDEYLKRTSPLWPVEIVSVPEERLAGNTSDAEAMRREAGRIRAKCPDGWPVATLDRQGKTISSREFAESLRRWHEGGVRGVAFVIGGALGLSEDLGVQIAIRLSFGPMTFPHDLAAAMPAEQVYRASSIVRGHPYHR